MYMSIAPEFKSYCCYYLFKQVWIVPVFVYGVYEQLLLKDTYCLGV